MARNPSAKLALSLLFFSPAWCGASTQTLKTGEFGKISIPIRNPLLDAPIAGATIVVLSHPTWMKIHGSSRLGPTDIGPQTISTFSIVYFADSTPSPGENVLSYKVAFSGKSGDPYSCTMKSDDAFSTFWQDCSHLDKKDHVYQMKRPRRTPPVTTVEFNGFASSSALCVYVTPWGSANFSTDDPIVPNEENGRVVSTSYAIDRGTPKRLQNGPELWASSAAFTTEGRHVLEYSSTDSVGLVEQLERLDVCVDTTPPTVGIAVNGNYQVSASSNYAITSSDRISLVGKDPVSNGVSSGIGGLFYALDGNAFTGRNDTYTKPIKFKPGYHEMTFSADDLAGNSTSGFARLFVDTPIDSEPPKTTLSATGMVKVSSAAIEVPAGSPIELTASDGKDLSSSGVAWTSLYIDVSPGSCPRETDSALADARILLSTAPYGSCERPNYAAPFTLAPGDHVIRFFSTDNAANVEAPKTFSIRVLARRN